MAEIQLPIVDLRFEMVDEPMEARRYGKRAGRRNVGMKNTFVTVLAGAILLPGRASIHGEMQGPRPAKPWTVMIYGGVDSTAESYILPHLAALKGASRAGLVGEVVLLMDG